MLLPELRDLIKAPWRKVLEELKLSGGMPLGELAGHTGASYMAVRTHCEDLTRAGFLVRTRLPRSDVGRPEIFYSLAAKADALFPTAGVGFSLELLEGAKAMFGESAPEKLLYQHFQKWFEHHAQMLDRFPELPAKALKLAALRELAGCTNRCQAGAGEPLRIVEFHNPLQRVFEHYPRARNMELRMLEQLLGARLVRHELPAGREMPPRVVFEIFPPPG